MRVDALSRRVCMRRSAHTHAHMHSPRVPEAEWVPDFIFFVCPRGVRAAPSCARTHTHNTHTHTHTHTCTHLHTLAHTSSFTHKCTLTGLEGGGMDCRCPRRCAAPAIFAEVQRGHRCCYHLVGGFRCERVRGGGVGV